MPSSRGRVSWGETPGLGVKGSRMESQRHELAEWPQERQRVHAPVFIAVMRAQSPNHKPLPATARMEGGTVGVRVS